MTSIREEESRDAAAVRRLHEEAFGGPTEAAIVDRLRRECADCVSLVASDDHAIVGHILFSPVAVVGDGLTTYGMGLAPMAVLPGRQRQGVGSRLVEEGLTRLRAATCLFVVVLGHPSYYPRFGFVPASRHGIVCPWEGVPEDAFMVLPLDAKRMVGVSGSARFAEAFDIAD